MFGFDAVAAFTHHVENAFDLVRKGKLTPTRELIAVALAAKDQMRVLIDQPAGERETPSDLVPRDSRRGPRTSDVEDATRGARSRTRAGAAGVSGFTAAGGRHGDRHQSVVAARRTARAWPRLGDRDDPRMCRRSRISIHGLCYLRWDVTLRTEHSRERRSSRCSCSSSTTWNSRSSPSRPREREFAARGRFGASEVIRHRARAAKRRTRPKHRWTGAAATAAEQRYLRDRCACRQERPIPSAFRPSGSMN